MKKIISCLIAIAMIFCVTLSVSAEISPSASEGNKYIKVDAVPVPDSAGTATPGIDSPAQVEINSDETVTLTAKPIDGYKFSHWKFITGEFEIIEGDLNSSTIVIKPTGDTNVRAEAYFVPEDEDVTPATTAIITPPDDGNKAPTTGDAATTMAVSASVVLVAIAALVIFKKRQNA
ncbi:MAG: LPXTG cell wall anchor domain-containing protein [Ruminococcus sp.]|nr:LPXTG cell wall anchor domain-containing protein [Ruminococcus sp.]